MMYATMSSYVLTNYKRRGYLESLPVLDPVMAGEILQNAQERTLDHKRGHDPQRALHVEAAVARQNVLVVAKLHRQDFLADIFQVDGGASSFRIFIAIIILLSLQRALYTFANAPYSLILK